ncbi:MAG: hypothetical protein JWN86_824 [Planctomycetota bacterium]|nr:hypothetical protein [Planctomycetota bacterium]
MKAARPTIGLSLALIAFLAIGMGALRSPTVLWAQIVTTAALTALLIATVGAIVGSPRAFWVGFAVVGWSYLFFSLGPWCSEQVAPWLLSTRMLDELYLRTMVENKILKGPGIRQTRVWDGPAMVFMHNFDYLRFHQIGHAIAAIAHGVFGGIVAVWLSDRRDPALAEARSS